MGRGSALRSTLYVYPSSAPRLCNMVGGSDLESRVEVSVTLCTNRENQIRRAEIYGLGFQNSDPDSRFRGSQATRTATLYNFNVPKNVVYRLVTFHVFSGCRR